VEHKESRDFFRFTALKMVDEGEVTYLLAGFFNRGLRNNYSEFIDGW
jgi:hypothetical protein